MNRHTNPVHYHREIYETLLDASMQSSGRPIEHQILKIGFVANFGAKFFCGLLSDSRVDAKLLTISEKLFSQALAPKPRSGRLVLHLATDIHQVGGHSRIVKYWPDHDRTSQHHIVLSNPSHNHKYYRKFLENKYSQIYTVKTQSLTNSCIRLRNMIQSIGPDILVLHINQDDICVPIAIANSNIPIAIYNHADHMYWAGSSFADVIADYRKSSMRITKKYRGDIPSVWVPYLFPLDNRQRVPSSTCRVQDSSVNLVTMASKYKFLPQDEMNFFRDYRLIMARCPHVRMHVIGVSRRDSDVVGIEDLPANIILHGTCTNPAKILSEADYFIEPYPLPTGIGAMESLVFGATPVPAYQTVELENSILDDLVGSQYLIPRTENADQYIESSVEEFHKNRYRIKNKSELSAVVETYFQDQCDMIEQLYYAARKNKCHPIVEKPLISAESLKNAIEYARFNQKVACPIAAIMSYGKMDTLIGSRVHRQVEYLIRKLSKNINRGQ